MKKRIEVNQPPETLQHQPLAGLAGIAPGQLPDHPAEPSPPRPAAKPWSVGRTRKGGYAISLEKRAKGKHVTVLRNVSGDAEALLKELKRRCGAGGVAREEEIELQGDHQAAVLAFLQAHAQA